MDTQDCKNDECKAIIDKGHKEYLLNLNSEQIDLIRHNEMSRKRFHKAIEKHGLRLVKILKIIEK